MATYSFRIKKGKYQLELSTTDKELLVEQFELWVKQASDYARKQKAKECKELVSNQIKAEEEITNKNIEAQISSKPKAKIPEINEPPKKEKKIGQQSEKTEIVDNLDIFYAPPSEKSLSSIVNKVTSGGVFDNILENSLKTPKTELRALGQSHTLERIIKANTDNLNEYAVASLAISKVNNLGEDHYRIYMAGLACIMKRVNVVPKNNFIEIEE